MRVLHVSQPVDGGVARWVAALAGHQRSIGWEVAVAAPAGGNLAATAESAGATVHRWNAVRAPGPTVAGESRRLGRIVRAAAPDVVHLHASKAGLAGRLALRGRVPTVFQPHGWSFFAVRGPTRRAAILWERAGARWAHRILCVSRAERERGAAAGIRGRWAVISNGTDTVSLRPPSSEERAALRARLGLAPGPLVVCVGRLDPAKGPDVLLAAWPAVTARVPPARLVVMGDGPIRAELEAGIPAGAELAGHRDDANAWLAAADVVAIPSRWEGMSLTMLDAMALGRPIVSTDVPGAADALDGGGGAVVPVEDPRALAEAIAARLGDPAGAEAEGREARRRAETHFSLPAAAGRTADLYERVLVEERGGGGQPDVAD